MRAPGGCQASSCHPKTQSPKASTASLPAIRSPPGLSVTFFSLARRGKDVGVHAKWALALQAASVDPLLNAANVDHGDFNAQNIAESAKLWDAAMDWRLATFEPRWDAPTAS
jgi:hypothetical protein